MKKKILALTLCVAMVAIAIVGGTLAYFTDTDAETNVFTVGNIDIDLEEWTDNNEPFVDVDGIMPGETETKIVDVKNIGNEEAYVCVTIVIPENMIPVWAEEVEQNWELIKGDENMKASGEYLFYYKKALTTDDPGNVTTNLLEAVTLDPNVTELTAADKYEVEVTAGGIQAESFVDAEDGTPAYKVALNALLDENGTGVANTVTASNVDEINTALAADADDAVVQLSNDVTARAKIVMDNTDSVLDGNNNTITKDASDETATINAGVKTSGGTIKNVTIVAEGDGKNHSGNGFRAIYVEGGLKDDLTIEGAKLTGLYPLSILGGSEFALTVKDSELNGWTSFATVSSAEFTNVKFGEGAGQKHFKPYSSVTLNECTFVDGFGMDSGHEGITIELINCKVGTEDVTAANFSTLFAVEDIVKNCTVVVNGVTVVWAK